MFTTIALRKANLRFSNPTSSTDFQPVDVGFCPLFLITFSIKEPSLSTQSLENWTRWQQHTIQVVVLPTTSIFVLFEPFDEP
jgi:hypothetical protein